MQYKKLSEATCFETADIPVAQRTGGIYRPRD